MILSADVSPAQVERLRAAGEGSVFEDADGAYEGGALRALTWLQGPLVGPARELAVRGELQRPELVAREALRYRLVCHGADSRKPNSILYRSPCRR